MYISYINANVQQKNVLIQNMVHIEINPSFPDDHHLQLQDYEFVTHPDVIRRADFIM